MDGGRADRPARTPGSLHTSGVCLAGAQNRVVPMPSGTGRGCSPPCPRVERPKPKRHARLPVRSLAFSPWLEKVHPPWGRGGLPPCQGGVSRCKCVARRGESYPARDSTSPVTPLWWPLGLSPAGSPPPPAPIQKPNKLGSCGGLRYPAQGRLRVVSRSLKRSGRKTASGRWPGGNGPRQSNVHRQGGASHPPQAPRRRP